MTSLVNSISSASNPQFKIWKSLTTSKGIKENNQFFLMGEKLVLEFLSEMRTTGASAGVAAGSSAGLESTYQVEYLIFEADSESEVFSMAKTKPGIKKALLSRELFKELDVLGTKAPLLILSFTDFKEKDFSIAAEGLELISPLGDPRNMGALVRTSLGFGVREIILTKESTHPFLPQAIKASSGAALKIKFSKTSYAISEIPISGENYALALFGENILKTKWPKNLRLWVGEEGPGLQLDHSQKKMMRFVNIPTTGVESLNAMVSTSLAIWEWRKQQS